MSDTPIVHIDHTRAEHKGRAWCGRRIESFSFVNIDHAAYNAKRCGYLLVCRDCVREVKKALDNPDGSEFARERS